MEFNEALRECDTILYLCSGNIIRSAFAELYSKHIGLDKIVISAGTTYHNTRITVEAENELIKIGVSQDLITNFSPTHTSNFLLDDFEKIMVIGMKGHHLREFSYNKSNILGKYLLSEVDGNKKDIADPYFEGGFDGVFTKIRNYIDKIHQIF